MRIPCMNSSQLCSICCFWKDVILKNKKEEKDNLQKSSNRIVSYVCLTDQKGLVINDLGFSSNQRLTWVTCKGPNLRRVLSISLNSRHARLILSLIKHEIYAHTVFFAVLSPGLLHPHKKKKKKRKLKLISSSYA